ncbi:allophanate hydrolase subunit 1 [Dietzia sp. ANT_WB102]|uniref:5-oxoprolinase subunit B family protein n=1 Tax=Dietzia sp. ANT_WB102 TaxID=2597345 RepID=UPI0011EEE402|nr:carboxyltransferase domain-containing protein [Dietzia sp. ANT_WB102]KAA0918747.1 allophanate hydrolase subunit 1 [Dietzia sp. ANT_WB102]
MTTTRIRRCGETALLVDCAELSEAVSLAGRIEQWRPDAVDVVAATRTVLVTVRDAAALPGLRRRLEALLAAAHTESGRTGDAVDSGHAGHAVTIDVRYDGPDLAAVADHAGMSTETLVRTHTSITWRAAFGGFAPGFFYLVDAREVDTREVDTTEQDAAGVPSAEPALPAVPRLSSPRARVPAGSVGLADHFCAVYPGASPGGWQLLGTTDAQLWDIGQPRPALLAPGVTVRFREIGGRSR